MLNKLIHHKKSQTLLHRQFIRQFSSSSAVIPNTNYAMYVKPDEIGKYGYIRNKDD